MNAWSPDMYTLSHIFIKWYGDDPKPWYPTMPYWVNLRFCTIIIVKWPQSYGHLGPRCFTAHPHMVVNNPALRLIYIFMTLKFQKCMSLSFLSNKNPCPSTLQKPAFLRHARASRTVASCGVWPAGASRRRAWLHHHGARTSGADWFTILGFHFQGRSFFDFACALRLDCWAVFGQKAWQPKIKQLETVASWILLLALVQDRGMIASAMRPKSEASFHVTVGKFAVALEKKNIFWSNSRSVAHANQKKIGAWNFGNPRQAHHQEDQEWPITQLFNANQRTGGKCGNTDSKLERAHAWWNWILHATWFWLVTEWLVSLLCFVSFDMSLYISKNCIISLSTESTEIVIVSELFQWCSHMAA